MNQSGSQRKSEPEVFVQMDLINLMRDCELR